MSKSVTDSASCPAPWRTICSTREGDQVPEGYRSLAFALRLRAADHTLTAKESSQVREHVVAKASKVLGASLRA